MKRVTLTIPPQPDYELLDSGEEEKLERYGSIVLARPDPQALWEKHLPVHEWQKADAQYVRSKGQTSRGQGDWKTKKDFPKQWEIDFGDLLFQIRATSFKHTGLFPEQLSNWDWMKGKLQEEARVLNLFAYTGGATLAAAQVGAEVTHVDASKTAVAWARENAELSGLGDKPIRWITEDVLAFLKREVKRGNKYDAIIMDPPAFGHGPKDELWKIEEDFLGLMDLCKQVLSEDPLFILINGYTAGYSSIVYQNNLIDLMKDYKGKVEGGELVIEETKSKRLLPCGIFARWERN